LWAAEVEILLLAQAHHRGLHHRLEALAVVVAAELRFQLDFLLEELGQSLLHHL
jgi:hypothetical protein